MHYSREVIQFSKVRNSETLFRLLAASLLLYMLLSFGAARFRLNAARREEQELEAACAALREENGQLQRQLAAAGEDAALADMARDRLGLVLPGERIFYFR